LIKVGIIGYRMGNIMSLVNAFKAIDALPYIAETPAALEEAHCLILPGVGAFWAGMEQLRVLGFLEAIDKLVTRQGRPLLGICLGMQLLGSVGEEFRITDGLGLIPGRITRLLSPGLPLPHVGWNDVRGGHDSGLLAQGQKEAFYFVHSYHLVPENPEHVIMTSDYGQEFACGVRRDNIMGVQFHPEKSHKAGLKLLRNFLEVSKC